VRLIGIARARQHRAEARGGGEQHRGLALDHAQVGGLVGVRVVHVQQLQHFAFGDLVGGVGQDAHHQHRIQLDHHLEAARIEEIADQHAGRIAPQRVGGLAPAAQVGFVHHVVVQQGGGVDELDHAASGTSARRHSRRHAPQQMQHRPQALAAGGHDVFGDLVDQQHIRRQAGADQAFMAAMSAAARACTSRSDGIATGESERAAFRPQV
jgi:hypothetical protein